MTKFSIAYITGRQEPCFDWFMDDLQAQLIDGDEIDLVIVDALRGQRDLERYALGPRGAALDLVVRHVKPKPTIYQGEYRVTSRDFWALSNARNTALVLARHDYIAFLDDRCHLGPRWLETVREGAKNPTRVIAGAYTKTEDGKSVTDHRLTRHPGGYPNCGGGWLFGGTFALPLPWALKTNGLEEGCDGLSMEDVIFGLMLANNGYRIDFAPSLLVNQDRSVASRSPTYARTDKGVSPNDKSHAALARFGKRTRTEFTPDLELLRSRQPFKLLPHPNPDTHRDWYDGELIADMKAPP